MPVIAPGRAVAEERPLRHRRAVQAPGPPRRGDGAGHDPRGGASPSTWPGAIRSYRDLPLMAYHIQTKERDEPRPRAGVLRTREFIMKDAYSLRPRRGGPGRRLRPPGRRLRPDLRPRRPGVVPGGVRRGGDGRHRRARVHGALRGGRERRRAVGRRLRRQRARSPPPRPSRSRACPAPLDAPERVDTPGARTVEQVCGALDVPAGALIKALPVLVGDDAEPLLVVVRGDHRLNEIKLANALGRPARAGHRGGGARPCSAPRRASSAPWARRRRCWPTRRCAAWPAWSRGANEPDAHLRGVEVGPRLRVRLRRRAHRRGRRHLPRRRRDPHRARDRGRQHLQARHALLRAAGRHLPGRGRQGAADLDGLLRHRARPGSWPPPSSSSPTTAASRGRARWRPFDIHLVTLGKEGEDARRVADEIYEELQREGMDVIYDDRDASPGEKFADAELLGCPLRLTVGRKGLEAGEVEAQVRRGQEKRSLPLEGAAAGRGGAVARPCREALRGFKLLGHRPLGRSAARDAQGPAAAARGRSPTASPTSAWRCCPCSW